MGIILTENFDSYSDGDLNGQGSWSGNTIFDIQGTVYIGTKAVKGVSSGGAQIEKLITQRSSGIISFKLRINNDGAGTINGPVFALKEGANYITSSSLWSGGTHGYIYGNTFSGGGGVIQDGWYKDTWYTIDVEWRSSPDKKVRFRVDGGAWTSWFAPGTEWTTGPDRIELYAAGSSTNEQYWDEISYTTVLLTQTLTEVVQVVSKRVNLTGRILSQTIQIASAKILAAGKTLIQSLSVSPTFSRVLTSLKTLTEVVAINSQKLFSQSRTIVERFVVSPIQTTVLTASKTLTEVLNIIDIFDAQQVFVEIWSETVKVISPATTRVLSAVRIITETIKVSGTILKFIGKSFIQTISVAPSLIYLTTKVLAERVIVLVNGVFAQMIILTSRLVVSSTSNFLRAKIITQAIEVVSSLIKTLTAYKTLSEVINVIVSKPVSIGRTIRATLKVTPLLAKKAGKTFVEVIVGATEWLFEKTQFTELTEHLTVSMSFVKASSKTFVQTIKVLPIFTYAMARVFLETVAGQVNFLIARAYEFTETVKMVVAFGSFAIGKLLKEIVPVRLIFNEGRNTIFTETIQVASNMVLQTAKIFTEVINAIGAMAGNAMARVFSQRVVAGATTRFRKTQRTILADSVKVAGQVYKMAGKTLAEAIEVVSAIGSWAIGKVIVQRVVVTPEYSKAWTLSRVLSEMVAVSGNTFNQAGKTFTEAIEVVGTFVLGTISKLLVETMQIIEKVSKSLPARVFSEVVSVSVNMANQNVKIFIETIEVVSEFVLGTISKLLLETVKVVAEYTKAWELSRLFEEIVTVTGNGFNQAGKIFAEVVNVTGTFILGTISKVLIEVVAVAFKFNVAMTRILTEFMIIVGRTTNLTGRIFTEILNVVNPLIAKLIGRIFTENVIALWDKTKFVLNGIQVGLWKKVARVTNGVWKKISRNS